MASTLPVQETDSNVPSSTSAEPANANRLRCRPLYEEVRELYEENILAKMLRVASERLQNNTPPIAFPEYVPQTGAEAGKYILREADFWTCGFFPGTLYSLLERSIKYPHTFPGTDTPLANTVDKGALRSHLQQLCSAWSAPIYAMASRTDTHDMSFIIQPALRASWELTNNPQSLSAIVTAAHSLFSRFNATVGAIRSWDALTQHGVCITSLTSDFLVIIDSMCNLDLLYYAAHHTSNPSLAAAATQHAHTLLRTHLRPEQRPPPSTATITATTTSSSSPSSTTPPPLFPQSPFTGPLYSTTHVLNFDPETGHTKSRMTAQGYAATSTWARGQAWAILGYAQTYTWTRSVCFRDAACGLADYFLGRVEGAADAAAAAATNTANSGAANTANASTGGGGDNADGRSKPQPGSGRYVPPWDFDAPVDEGRETNPLRDSSAGVIAANGMLVLGQALMGDGEAELGRWYIEVAVLLIRDVLGFSLATERARIVVGKIGGGGEGEGKEEEREGKGGKGKEEMVFKVEDVVQGRRFDAVLKNATANHNARDHKRYWDHGLVYADYYLVEFGNRLLRMGLV